MLAKVYRLTKKKEFEQTKEKGKLYQSGSFGMLVLDRGDNEPSKFGFVISTKIAKDAVIRNKTKRALRESVRQTLSYMKPGYNVVFLTKQAITRAYTHDIMDEVKKNLESAGIVE